MALFFSFFAKNSKHEKCATLICAQIVFTFLIDFSFSKYCWCNKPPTFYICVTKENLSLTCEKCEKVLLTRPEGRNFESVNSFQIIASTKKCFFWGLVNWKLDSISIILGEFNLKRVCDNKLLIKYWIMICDF